MYFFKNFPGEKPPDPRSKGMPRLTRRGGARLTRGGMGPDRREGGEGKGKGKGKGRGKGLGLGTPQNLYAAYAHVFRPTSCMATLRAFMTLAVLDV
jgi:hypothetical protein